MTEQLIIDDICSRLEGRLSAVGTQVLLTRPPGVNHLSSATDAERASSRTGPGRTCDIGALRLEALRERGHVLLLAAHDRHPWSASAVRELLQDHVVKRTGFDDCSIHAKTWDLLRMTRMATVRPRPATCPTRTTSSA